MLKAAYDIIVKQLQKNLDCQDFYKNLCTKVSVNGHTLQLLHPWFIKDALTGNDVFPEKAQTDIDKEFAPSVAIFVKLSMKEDKPELENFRSLENFSAFKEIKDYGSRMYAMDFDTDVEKAATECIAIIQNVFNGNIAKRIIVTTADVENGEEICRNVVTPKKTLPPVGIPKKEAANIKVDGVALRVIEEETIPKVTDGAVETSEGETVSADVSNRTYKTAMWILGFVVVIFIIGLLDYVNSKNTRDEYADEEEVVEPVAVDTIVEPVSTEARARFLGTEDKHDTKEAKQEEAKTEIIGKWRESSSGSLNYIWLLERDKSSGKYRLTVSYPGGANMTYDCVRKKIKRNEYVFHDPDLARSNGSNGMLTLNAGETIYFIPNFDDGSNAILLIMPGNVTRVYTNDIDNRYYEFFASLQSI